MIVKVSLKSVDKKRPFGAHLGFYEAEKVAPPSEKFHYWTVWYKHNQTKENMVQFFRENCVESLSIEGGDDDYEQFENN